MTAPLPFRVQQRLQSGRWLTQQSWATVEQAEHYAARLAHASLTTTRVACPDCLDCDDTPRLLPCATCRGRAYKPIGAEGR